MKKLIKTVLMVALVMGSTSLFAQKFGHINMQELVFAMPETAEMQKNLEAYQKELGDQLETIQVEYNNKLNEYTKASQANTLTETVKKIKEKELVDLQSRFNEVQQFAQQELQKKQNELLEPIIAKAQDAVKKISKAGGYTIVFDTSINSIAYSDDAIVTDLLKAVKDELGIKDTPAAAPAK